jgi:hypothetical protein
MFNVGGSMFSLFCLTALPVSAQTATNAPPALIPAYAEIPPPFWAQHQAALILGGLLFIIGQSFILWKMLMRLQPAVEPPVNLARAALNQLLDEPEDGRLLSEVSQILRRYIGTAFQMRGEELTTFEFCSALAQNGKIDPQLCAAIASFLRECDVRKFAPENKLRSLDAVEQALSLVEQIHKKHESLLKGTTKE